MQSQDNAVFSYVKGEGMEHGGNCDMKREKNLWFQYLDKYTQSKMNQKRKHSFLGGQ